MTSEKKASFTNRLGPALSGWPTWLLFAGLLVALHMALSTIFGVRDYRSFFQWDSRWYGSIVDSGYQIHANAVENQNNVAFFPGYSLFCWVLKNALGIPTWSALLVGSALASAGFWFYWLGLLLRRLRFSDDVIAILTLLFLCQPGAFFLLAAYSESFFLFNIAGYLYWASDSSRRAVPLAILHGILMTATRLVGIVPLCFPLFLLLFRPRSFSKALRGAAMAAGGSLGLVAFLAYCQIKFGKWDLYWEAVRVGWKVHSDWYAVLNPRLYRALAYSPYAPDATGRLLSVLTGVLVVAGGFWIARKKERRASPLLVSFFLLGGGLLWVTLVGRSAVDFTGMVRYLLPVNLLLIPCLGVWLEERGSGRFTELKLTNPLVILSLLGLLLQEGLLFCFAKAAWIA